jgi:hypothetical protein
MTGQLVFLIFVFSPWFFGPSVSQSPSFAAVRRAAMSSMIMLICAGLTARQ